MTPAGPVHDGEGTPTLDALVERLRDRSARIGVFGLGYVGLPLAMRFAEAGFAVLGFDVDARKTDTLNAGRSYIRGVPDARVAAARKGRFEATGVMERASEADALVLCLPTPLDAYRQPDLGFVRGTLDAIMPHLRPGQLISLESTTYPGTTEEEICPRLAARDLRTGQDVFVVYSPEREDPGNTRFDLASIPKVCSGVTAACLAAGTALYEQAVEKVVPVSNTRTAELTKLLENIHRAVNIGLVNEMKLIAERMDIDIHEVIEAAATKPFGFVPYYPGPGLGGHCIPIDPFYLTWKAREYGLHTRFIELAGEINSAMPAHVVDRLVEGLNRQRKALNGSRVLILGLAYKKNVDDTRESPSAELLDMLEQRGAEIAYSDPYVPTFPRMRRYGFDLESTPLDAASLGAFDAVVIATDHDAFDYALVGEHAKLVVDARGRMPRDASNVITA